MSDGAAAAEGFALEALIGAGVKALRCDSGSDGTTAAPRHLGEQEIRSHFSDASLNGVDHWILYEGQHIFAQTKWKETVSQPEVAQFLGCVDRLMARIPESERSAVYLLWVCKHMPTKHSLSILAERAVDVVCCSVSIEMLARNAIGWVAETYGLDPIPGLQTVPIKRALRTAAVASALGVTVPAAAPAAASRAAVVGAAWDETTAGVAARAEMMDVLRVLHDCVTRKLLKAASSCPTVDVRMILEANFPLTLDGWTDGRYSRVNFNALLRTVKVVCCPTRSKKTHSSLLFFYCKVRYLSTELGRLAQEYMAKRGLMLGEKSSWARRLPTLVCTPEPMTHTEYLGLVTHCEDYCLNVVLDGVGGGRGAAAPLDSLFHANYCVL
jgi:hypothetical protein